MNESDKDTGKLTPFFILGLSSIAAQVIYLREILSVFYGTEFAIALVLGAWLLWTGIGAIASAFVSRFLTANIFILFALGLSIALPIDLWIIRNLRGYFDAPAGEYLSLSNLVVSILITTSLPCALFGAIFTTGTKIIRRFSSIYIIETAGCFVGGLALSLFLIQIINPFAILALCSLLILISCATSLYNLINRLLRLISILTAITLTAILIGSDRIDFASHKKFWRNFHPEFSFAEGTDSRYGYISVISYQGEYTIYQNGHKLYSLSKEEEQIPLAHLVMLQAVQPNDILLIGGGISGALREILKHEITKVDYIELDPILVKTTKKYLSPEDINAFNDIRVRFLATDGRNFLNTTTNKYDTIIVNVPDPTSALLNRYFTTEFFGLCSEHLNKNGVISVGPVTSHTFYTDEYLIKRNRTIYSAIKENFSFVTVTCGSSGSFLATNKPGGIITDENTLISQLAKKNIININMYQITDKFCTDKINYELRTGAQYNPFETNAGSPLYTAINSDHYPIAHYLSVLLWNHLLDDKVSIIENLTSKDVMIAFFILFGIVTTGFITSRRRRITTSSLFIFLLGLFGMSSEITLLFLFQNEQGCIYQYIGALISVFMLGLAVGALIIKKIRLNLFMLFALAVTISVTTPFINGLFLITSFMCLTGMVTGAGFPLLLQRNEGMPKAAGILYGFDIIGGSVGSLIISAFFFPLVGVVMTSVLVACLLTAGLIASISS